MSNVGYAILSVIPSAKGFGAALSQDVDPQMHGAGLSAGKLLAGGLLAGTAIIAAGIGAILKTGFDEAKDASAGIAQLEAGIKSTGGAAGVTVDHMTSLAGSIQSMSGQTDDSIVAAEQLLLTFTNIKNVGANKIFDEATLAAANMAAKMGGDASSNAMLLGKALNDPTKGMVALTRAGVEFTEAQKTQITAMMKSGDVVGAQNIILGELKTQFGGAAEAAGNSLPGQLARGQRAFEDMSQAVAENLIPVVMPAVLKITEAITAASPAIAEFARKFSVDLKNGIAAAQPFLDAVGTSARDVGAWITGSAIPAVQGLVQWMKDSKTALEITAGVITVLLLPAIISMGVQSTIAWATGAASAVTSAATQFASHYSVVAGWVAQGAAAVTTGVTNGIIWAQLYAEAALGAAKNVASHVLVAVSGWGAQAAAAVAAGVTTAGVWASQALEAGLGAAKSVASHVLVAVSGWGAQAAAAIAAGLTTAGVWAAQALEAGIGAAKAIGGLLVVAGGWIATAATAMASGVMMAAAWVIGLGPVGWIIAAVVAIGAAMVLAYNKIGWFRDAVNVVWAGLKSAASAVADWVVGAFNNVVGFFNNLPGNIGRAVSGIASTITAPFRSAFNAIANLWNGTVGRIGVTIPSWVPEIGGKSFSVPNVPTLADGATILPSAGGTIVRVAEAGRAETVVDTGKMNRLIDQATAGGGGGGGMPDTITLVDADGSFIARMRTEASGALADAFASATIYSRGAVASR